MGAVARVLTGRSHRRLTRDFGRASFRTTRNAAPPLVAPSVASAEMRAAMKILRRRLTRPLAGPQRPAPWLRPRIGGGMCEAQRVDLAAAQAGKITWAQYFAMWGPGG